MKRVQQKRMRIKKKVIHFGIGVANATFFSWAGHLWEKFLLVWNEGVWTTEEEIRKIRIKSYVFTCTEKSELFKNKNIWTSFSKDTNEW